ncbi:hypothetical protein [Phytohabitans kaempferiae]|uniref:MASE1 domain-containing protein n=1 Tax=Phytohabitans kaempferiae TaxID=1620943 RepID=A0ABV6M8S0_9ACTN
MIPTLILFGLIFGRWWRSTLAAAAVGWPAVLVASDAMSIEAELLGASALAIVNAAAGVLSHQVILRIVRRLHPSGSSHSDT